MNKRIPYCIEKIYKNGFPMECICLYDEKSSAWCPYRSLEAILENWEFMPNLHKPAIK